MPPPAPRNPRGIIGSEVRGPQSTGAGTGWKLGSMVRRLLNRAHLPRVDTFAAGFWRSLAELEASRDAYTPNQQKYPFIS